MRKILHKVECTESELIRREAEQRSLFRALPDLIWVKDTQGYYLRCNRRFEDFFGAKEEEILGKTDYDFVDKEIADSFRENDLLAIESGGSRANEEEVTYANDGHKEFLETIKTPLYNGEGEVTGVLGIGRDLSQHIMTKNELKKHQEDLEKIVWERTKELESMVIRANSGSRAKSEFLANMSHEIRTPMTSIIGMTTLALKTDDDEKKNSYIEKSNESATNLLGLINDILDFSKIEAGKLEVENIFFNLSHTLYNIANLLKSKMEEKHQKFNVQINSDLSSNYVGDPLRLGQVLLNLLSNAVKFTPNNGEIDVLVSVVESDIEKSKLLFSVVDNGIGISKEFEEKIFDAFDQADNSFSRKYGGTGLGLAISKRLVNLMGGEISFENNSKGGATFSFTVSLKKVCALEDRSLDNVEDGKERKMEDALNSIDGLEILLVDDTPENQEVISEFLEMEGAHVTVASNGLEAIEILKSKSFDGVLMDCQMPIMDGYEATQKIRQELHLLRLPIVAITGNVMKEDIEKTKSSGMNDIIAKPIQMDDFYLKIARWMHRKESA